MIIVVKFGRLAFIYVVVRLRLSNFGFVKEGWLIVFLMIWDEDILAFALFWFDRSKKFEDFFFKIGRA